MMVTLTTSRTLWARDLHAASESLALLAALGSRTEWAARLANCERMLAEHVAEGGTEDGLPSVVRNANRFRMHHLAEIAGNLIKGAPDDHRRALAVLSVILGQAASFTVENADAAEWGIPSYRLLSIDACIGWAVDFARLSGEIDGDTFERAQRNLAHSAAQSRRDGDDTGAAWADAAWLAYALAEADYLGL